MLGSQSCYCDWKPLVPGPALTELYSGVDALYCSGKAALPGAVLELLASYRAEAEEQECDVAFLLDGEEFQLAPHGFGRYRYCLRHPNGQVGIQDS